jgi:TPP-dependent trihydroxycyclohexane-1,2-dione (THcHDO) dehydratase
MTKTIRLTAAQALVKFLARQMTVIDGEKLPLFAGMARGNYEKALRKRRAGD